jgi:hypothetical protein
MADYGGLALLNLAITVFVLFRIRKEALALGEPWRHLILPVWFMWWLVYPLWLFLWPGLHRPRRFRQLPEEFLPIVWARKKRGGLTR